MATAAELQIQRLLKSARPEARERQIRRAAQDAAILPELLALAQNALASQPALARELAGYALQIAKITKNALAAAQSGRLLGQALRAEGRHEDALNALNAAAGRAEQAGEERLAAQIQIGAIDSLGVLGRVAEAFALANRLETRLRLPGAESDAARVLVNAGTLHYRRDEYAQAADYFERALPLFPPEDAVSRARTLANYGAVLTETGEFERGVALFEQARQAFETAEMPRWAAMTDANIGWLRYVSGEYAAALASLTRAFRVFAESGQELDAAKCDADRAEVYRELYLDAEALECYGRALPVLESFGLAYERGRALVGMAAVLACSKREAEARNALQVAEEIFQSQKNGLQTAYTRLVRAYLLRAEGNTAEMLEAAALAERGFARRHAGFAAEARFLRIEAEMESNPDAARAMRGVSKTAQRNGRRWLACRAERALGLRAAQQGDTSRALRHFRAGIAFLEDARDLISAEDLHVAFLQGKFTIYEDCVQALLRRGTPRDVREALNYVERSRSRLLLERIQSAVARAPESGEIAEGEQTTLRALRAEISRAYQQMNALNDGTPRRFAGNTAPAPDAVARLEFAYRGALRESDLLAQREEFDGAAPSETPSIAAIQAALLPDETLIEYFATGQAIGAFLLTRNRLRVFPEIARLPDILTAMRRLRWQLQRLEMQADYARDHAGQMQAGIERVLQGFYSLLLRPFSEDLQEKLVIAPYGPLHGLPFHAFHDGADYAIARFEIIYTPSAAIFHAGRRCKPEPAAPNALFALGNAEPNIRHVTIEIEQIAALFPDAQVFTGNAATRAAFQEFAPCCRYAHLATHALFRADNPLFSGLQCADGWLMARDLYGMRLHCELATLSACRTGETHVEAGDELFGLVRGFLGAGAQSVAASLWEADDAATAALMTRFYTHLANPAFSRAAALRAAQREIRALYPHPYYWAAFALIGAR